MSSVPITTIGRVQIPTQRGLDAVTDLSLDNTGSADCAPILRGFLDQLAGNPAELHFPPGCYRFASCVETNAAQLKFIGDGHVSNITEGPVVFFTDQPLKQMLWFHTPQPASNLQSVWMEHIQFRDTSPGHNQMGAAIRITNQANFHLGDVGGYQLVPRRYNAGTVAASQGSKTVIGSGMEWNESMLPGFIILGGYPYEITSIQSPNQLSLALAFIGASSPAMPYAISSGGMLLWCDPGQGFTQYGQVRDLKSHTVGCPVYMSAGTRSTGTSRIKFWGGYVNGGGIADSIGCYMGPFSDTTAWQVAANSFAFGVVIANGHQHDISSADFENAGPAPPVTGGPSGYAGNKAVLIMSDNSSDTWGNRVVNNYMRQVGTAIELAGASGFAPTKTKVAFNTFRSNSVNFINGNATDTSGEVDGVFYGSNVHRHHSEGRT